MRYSIFFHVSVYFVTHFSSFFPFYSLLFFFLLTEPQKLSETAEKHTEKQGLISRIQNFLFSLYKSQLL